MATLLISLSMTNLCMAPCCARTQPRIGLPFRVEGDWHRASPDTRAPRGLTLREFRHHERVVMAEPGQPIRTLQQFFTESREEQGVEDYIATLEHQVLSQTYLLQIAAAAYDALGRDCYILLGRAAVLQAYMERFPPPAHDPQEPVWPASTNLTRQPISLCEVCEKNMSGGGNVDVPEGLSYHNGRPVLEFCPDGCRPPTAAWPAVRATMGPGDPRCRAQLQDELVNMVQRATSATGHNLGLENPFALPRAPDGRPAWVNGSTFPAE